MIGSHGNGGWTAMEGVFVRENRQNLHVFNLWPVIYHTKKNSCGNPTPETLSVEIYTSQHDYPKSTCFYFVAIDVSQQKQYLSKSTRGKRASKISHLVM
jgi:hypothetical protein